MFGAGVPRTVAMKLVGHRTESVSRGYSIVDENMLREGVEELATWGKEGGKIGPDRATALLLA